MSEGSEGEHRVLFDISYYSDNKAAVKAPLKEQDLSWQFIGREGSTTKGRYSGEGVSVFVMYTDEHADFTVQGSDEETKQAILDAWEEMETLDPDEAGPTPAEQEASKEVRLWEFKKPTQRPGEPDALYERRLEAWKEEDPREA